MKLQRRFLWGGDDENKKMAWVSWDSICNTKEKGGLGIKNLEVFNIVLLLLLLNWRWRILTTEGTPVWKEVLAERYGLSGRWPSATEDRNGWGKTSIWWRDLCQLGDGTCLGRDWFEEAVKVNNGERKYGSVLDG